MAAGEVSAQPMAEGLLLLKVPRWLSEVWQRSPQESVVADLDLQTSKMRLTSSCGRGRPTSFNVFRRASPELFAFPVCKENDEVTVEGGIAEALTVTADLNDTNYKTMLEQRLKTQSFSGGNRSKLEEKLIPLNRHDFLAGEAVDAAMNEPEIIPGTTPETEELVWQGVKKALMMHPEGVTCDELLEMLPGAPGFLCVRNALAAMAEPVEIDGVRCFLRRQTASTWAAPTMPPALMSEAALMGPLDDGAPAIPALEGPLSDKADASNASPLCDGHPGGSFVQPELEQPMADDDDEEEGVVTKRRRVLR